MWDELAHDLIAQRIKRQDLRDCSATAPWHGGMQDDEPVIYRRRRACGSRSRALTNQRRFRAHRQVPVRGRQLPAFGPVPKHRASNGEAAGALQQRHRGDETAALVSAPHPPGLRTATECGGGAREGSERGGAAAVHGQGQDGVLRRHSPSLAGLPLPRSWPRGPATWKMLGYATQWLRYSI